MRRLGPADYQDMPWKNGGGTTRELLKLPHPADPERFLARLSIATVSAPGPFSPFPGVDRTLLLLEGAGMGLRFGEGPEALLSAPLRPFCFPGEAPLHCRLLGGPVRDFNLMVDRATAASTLEVLRLEPGARPTLERADGMLLHVLAGNAVVGGELLRAEETLVLEPSGPVPVHGDDGTTVLAIRLLRHR
jgi:environmental stress-induced protein Ves